MSFSKRILATTISHNLVSLNASYLHSLSCNQAITRLIQHRNQAVSAATLLVYLKGLDFKLY